MKAQIKTITPAMAKQILDVQEKRIAKGTLKQRTLSEPTVAKYAADMAAGHWLANNQGIGFDRKGNLVDGRHRLWAIVRCKKSVKILVVYGLEDYENTTLTVRAADTIDCGRSRSSGQQLMIDGIPNGNMMASSAKSIAVICAGATKLRLSLSMTKSILGIFDAQLRKAITLLHTNARIARAYLVGPAAMYMLGKPTKAAAFLTDYYDMANLPAGSRVLALRHWLATHPGGGGQDGYNRLRVVTAAMEGYDKGELGGPLRSNESGDDWLRGLVAPQVAAVRKALGRPTE